MAARWVRLFPVPGWFYSPARGPCKTGTERCFPPAPTLGVLQSLDLSPSRAEPIEKRRGERWRSSRHKDYSPQWAPRARGVLQAGSGGRGVCSFSYARAQPSASSLQHRQLLGAAASPRFPKRCSRWRKGPSTQGCAALTQRANPQNRPALRGVTKDTSYGGLPGRGGRGRARATAPSGGALGGCSPLTVRRSPALRVRRRAWRGGVVGG